MPGLEFNPRDLILLREGGRRLDPSQMRQLFAGPEAPTAVFLLADFWAPPLVAELRRLGLRVPEDVALVGFDDVVPPGLDDLGLTTMAQDFDGIGKTAGSLILRRLTDPQAPCVSEVFPARLVVRHSSLGYAPAAPSPPSAPVSADPPGAGGGLALAPPPRLRRGPKPRPFPGTFAVALLPALSPSDNQA